MPELPEVETIARGLDKRIAGDVIESVWLGEKPQPLKSSAAEIVSVLEHSRIVHVRRVGKHIALTWKANAKAESVHPGWRRRREREREPRRLRRRAGSGSCTSA